MKVSRFARKVFLVCALILLAFLVGLYVFIPRILNAQIVKAVRNSCPSCELKIASTSVSWISPGNVVFDGLHFTGGTPGATEYDLSVRKIRVSISIPQLFERHLHITQLQFDNVATVITDGEKHTPSSSPDDSPSRFDFLIDQTQVSDSSLVYIRHYRGTEAILHLGAINCTLETFGNGPEARKENVRLLGKLQIEESGQVEIDTLTSFYRSPAFVDAKIQIRKQNLARVSPFFEHNAGVKLKGIMNSGIGHAVIHGENLRSEVNAHYQGLEITLEPHVDRSSMSAFFQNLGASVTINESNMQATPARSTRQVDLLREPREPIVGFILRGLKEAALEVAKAG